MLRFLTDTTPEIRFQRRLAPLTLRESQDATIEATNPPWIREVDKKLEQLRKLEPNWDGEGAPPVSFECCISALMFLLESAANETPAPQIVPTSEGGLQLEWHRNGIDLEVRFSPTMSPSFFYVGKNGDELEGDVEQESQRIRIILRALPARNERQNTAR